MTDPQSKTIRTIIRQYRVDADVAYSEVKDNVHTVEEYHNALKKIEDQALSDISKIINECRPEPCGITEFDLVVDQYQSNLRKAIK